MVFALLGVVLAAVLAVLLLLDRYGSRSANRGSTREEAAAAMTGDQWLDGGPPVRIRMTRAVWIEARPERVWPWIAQMGRGAGWYSYDWLDNGRRRSASHVVGWVPEPQIGDAAVIGYLRHLEAGREIAWWLAGTRFLGHWFRGVMLYRVGGRGERCRLTTRFQADVDGPLARLACRVFRSIDGFMARRQLAGIKERAERYGNRSSDPDNPETGDRDQYQFYQSIYASGEEVGVAGRQDAGPWREQAVRDGVIEPGP